MERKLPLSSKKPVTPSMELSLSKASVLAGSSKLTLPSLSCCFRDSGKASASTLRPTDKAVLGLTPGPTPPFFAPAIALWSCKALPQKASLPKVSNRKICLPFSIICWAFLPMTSSKPESCACWLSATPSCGVSNPKQATTDAATNRKANNIFMEEPPHPALDRGLGISSGRGARDEVRTGGNSTTLYLTSLFPLYQLRGSV